MLLPALLCESSGAERVNKKRPGKKISSFFMDIFFKNQPEESLWADPFYSIQSNGSYCFEKRGCCKINGSKTVLAAIAP